MERSRGHRELRGASGVGFVSQFERANAKKPGWDLAPGRAQRFYTES